MRGVYLIKTLILMLIEVLDFLRLHLFELCLAFSECLEAMALHALQQLSLHLDALSVLHDLANDIAEAESVRAFLRDTVLEVVLVSL